MLGRMVSVAGIYCTISRPGDLRLSQLGCPFLADWIQVCFVSLWSWVSFTVKFRLLITRWVSQPSPFSTVLLFNWTFCPDDYLYNATWDADVFLNCGCVFPEPFYSPFPPTVHFQTGKVCSFFFFFSLSENYVINKTISVLLCSVSFKNVLLITSWLLTLWSIHFVWLVLHSLKGKFK